MNESLNCTGSERGFDERTLKLGVSGKIGLGWEIGGYTMLYSGSSIVIKRLTTAADDERISRREGGGEDGANGSNGDKGEEFNLSESSINRYDIRVVRKLR